jgi:predicted helicase
MEAIRRALGGDRAVTVEDLFGYLYAVVHRDDYRQQFAERLKTDFPRIPIPRDAEAFLIHADLGRKLVALHASNEPLPCADAAKSVTDPAITIGGYPVLARWRKQRRNRALSPEEKRHEALIAAVLEQTHLVRKELAALPQPW